MPPTLAEAQGGDAVGLAVLLQAQLLLVQVHGGGVDPRPLQLQADPLPPQPPEGSAGSKVSISVTTQDRRAPASGDWGGVPNVPELTAGQLLQRLREGAGVAHGQAQVALRPGEKHRS